jgi:NitT/TauT family transport system permease protein
MPFFSIDKKPNRALRWVLSLSLFVILIGMYGYTSHKRKVDNPHDKVTPSFSEMARGFYDSAFEPNRKGEHALLVDTVASGKRFLVSFALLLLAIAVGLHMGLFPYCEALLYRFTLFFDKIPALALLPILFIVFGLGETSKIALILLGVFPTIVLDTYLRARATPREQIVKAQTLGSSPMEIAYLVVLPRILPDVLDTIRLNFKSMILFLIAGESLAATVGLGYRIFVVRRYVAMDVIIPYVIWMSILALVADLLLKLFVKRFFRWRNTD